MAAMQIRTITTKHTLNLGTIVAQLVAVRCGAVRQLRRSARGDPSRAGLHSMTTPPTALDGTKLTMTLVNGDSADIGYAVVSASDLSASNPSGMTTLRNALVSQFGIF